MGGYFQRMLLIIGGNALMAMTPVAKEKFVELVLWLEEKAAATDVLADDIAVGGLAQVFGIELKGLLTLPETGIWGALDNVMDEVSPLLQQSLHQGIRWFAEYTQTTSLEWDDWVAAALIRIFEVPADPVESMPS